MCMPLRSSYAYLYKSRPLKLDPPWSDSHRRRWLSARCWSFSACGESRSCCQQPLAKPSLCGGDRQRRQAWPRRIAQHVRALLGRVRQLDQADQSWGQGVGLGPGMRTSTHLIFGEGQLSIFHVTRFQTVKIISIGVQLQDLAFEIPIWQD